MTRLGFLFMDLSYFMRGMIFLGFYEYGGMIFLGLYEYRGMMYKFALWMMSQLPLSGESRPQWTLLGRF